MKVFVFALFVAFVVAESTYPVAYKAYEYPAQPYSFNYEVKDDYYNNFGHSESNDGKTTSGSYHVALPDGRHQTVTYKADDYGYVADVKYDGYAKDYDYKPVYKAQLANYHHYPTYHTYHYPAYHHGYHPYSYRHYPIYRGYP